MSKRPWGSGFTLVELMVTVAIATILAIIGGITIQSRLRTGNLEAAAQQLVSDVSYARSAAMFKGCATRFIFCKTKTCLTASDHAVAQNANKKIQIDSGAAASYYAILRNSSVTSGATCENTSAIPATGSTSDGYANWDFDRRPQALPKGIAFTNIYDNIGNLDDEWAETTEAVSSNSLYFSSQFGDVISGVNIPNGSLMTNGNKAVLQVGFDDCNPASADDCPAYIISVGSGGNVDAIKCSKGTRGTGGNDNCF